MWQVYSKSFLLYYRDSGKHQHTSLHALQFTLRKKNFSKISCPLFSTVCNIQSAFLLLAQLIFATTYCIASIVAHVHLAYLIQQPKL